MQVKYFDPLVHVIDRVVLGAGDWDVSDEPTERQIIKKNLPFSGVRKPIRSIDVSGLFSLDGKDWSPEFPAADVLHEWKNSEYDIIEGVIRLRIEIVPDATMKIREIGFYCGKTMFFYKTMKEFVVGKMVDLSTTYAFNYNVRCHFASPSNINDIARSLLK